MQSFESFMKELTTEVNQLRHTPDRTNLVDSLLGMSRLMRKQMVSFGDALSFVDRYLTRYEQAAHPDDHDKDVIRRIDNLMIGWAEKIQQAST